MREILTNIDDRGVTTVTLNRPERHNAFDDRLLRELHTAVTACRDDGRVRVVVLAAVGRSYCAGADLAWMQRTAACSEEENYREALAMAEFFADLATLPKPTLAVVQGAAFGGGVGLVAACDLAIAADSVRFALSEVKIGLVPAVISPYLIRAIGERQTRRFALTGEPFTAREAREMGLVHAVVAEGDLAAEMERVCALLLAGGPAALAAVKTRLFAVYSENPRERMQATARCIAEIRGSEEGREGVAAFLEKRKPSWWPG